MNNQLFVSMLGASSVQQNDEKKADQVSTDSSAFSSCLKEATSAKQETGDLISEKETKKEATERQKTEQADAQAQAKAAQAKMVQNPKALGGKAFLYDMMYRNPDTLSLADKQALRLDDLSKNLKMLSTQNPEAQGAQGKLTTTGTTGQKEAAVLDGQKFNELLGKGQNKGKEEAGKPTTEAGQAASATGKAESGAKGESTSAVLTANKAEETHRTQQLTQTQKRQQVIDQIVTHMEIRNFTSKDVLSLRLNPEYLGELRIQLSRTKDGELSANFLTDSDETREILTDSRAQLREQIERKGMKLHAIEIEKI
ncbi:MAG: flagellar hook-length control protein FliK [bacterium]|nr:flagellar hook-length control protein FliK [bacterium]